MENTNLNETHYPQNLVADASGIDRATFYRKTYMHVALALLAFIAVESWFLSMPALVDFMLSLTDGYKWLIVLGAFWLGSSLSERLAHAESESTQYLGLLFFVVLEALIFLPLIAIAQIVGGGTEVLTQAALVTLGLFLGLTAVVFMTKIDFSFLRTVLVVGTFVALGAIVAGMIFGFNLGFWFSVGMVVFAAAAILYQTYQLKFHYSTDQYVGASVGIFASVMLLFWYILSIFLSRD